MEINDKIESNVWADLRKCASLQISSPQIICQANVRGFFAFAGVCSFAVGAFGLYKNDKKLVGVSSLGSLFSAAAFWMVDQSDKSHQKTLARIQHP